MKSTTFVNELNNKITVKVKQHRTDSRYRGVTVMIVGPTSMSENLITLKEAKELHKTLGKYLRDL